MIQLQQQHQKKKNSHETQSEIEDKQGYYMYIIRIDQQL